MLAMINVVTFVTMQVIIASVTGFLTLYFSFLRFVFYLQVCTP